MATILDYYTRFLAGLAAALAVLWGFLAYAAPVNLEWMFGSHLVTWGPALWFLYLALRFGHPRSAARFYARSVLPWGRARIILFGFLSIGTLAVGSVVGLVILMPGFADTIGTWGPISTLFIAMLYLLAAHFGSRKLAFSSGLVRLDGEPVLEEGATLSPEALRFPYRG